MVKQDAPRYHYPVETWDEKKCAKMAKRTATDGMGTPYPFKGAVPELPKTVDYNGGTVLDKNGGISINGDKPGDKWYQGVVYQKPILAPGYSWVSVPTWCQRIVKN